MRVDATSCFGDLIDPEPIVGKCPYCVDAGLANRCRDVGVLFDRSGVSHYQSADGFCGATAWHICVLGVRCKGQAVAESARSPASWLRKVPNASASMTRAIFYTSS